MKQLFIDLMSQLLHSAASEINPNIRHKDVQSPAFASELPDLGHITRATLYPVLIEQP